MATTTILPQVEKSIKYDRESGDYACTLILDGEPISHGFETTYALAEAWCNAEYYRILEDGVALPPKPDAVCDADPLPFEPSADDLAASDEWSEIVTRLGNMPIDELRTLYHDVRTMAQTEGAAPSMLLALDRSIEYIEALDVDDADLAPQAISTLTDGSTVYGRIDPIAPHEHCSAHVTTADGWCVSAGDDQSAGVWHKGLGINIDDLTPASFQSLKRLVNSGTIEHLFVCGDLWDTHQDVPAQQPAPAGVTVSREQYAGDEEEPQAHSLKLSCGAADFYLHHDPLDTPAVPWDVVINGHYFDSFEDIRAVYDAVALLQSPQLDAACTLAGISLPQPPAPVPATPALSGITVEDVNCGDRFGDAFLTIFSHGRVALYLDEHGYSLNIDKVEVEQPALLPEALALLNSPEVRKARMRVEAGLPPLPLTQLTTVRMAA